MAAFDIDSAGIYFMSVEEFESRPGREKTRDAGARFLEYATAFEQTYVDDDWQRLARFFAADAVYAVTGGPPMGGRWKGRDAVIGQLHWIVDALDRRFDERRVVPLGEPKVADDSVELRWRACYKKQNCPDLVFDGVEHVKYRGESIALLQDIIEDGADKRIQDHLERWLD